RVAPGEGGQRAVGTKERLPQFDGREAPPADARAAPEDERDEFGVGEGGGAPFQQLLARALGLVAPVEGDVVVLDLGLGGGIVHGEAAGVVGIDTRERLDLTPSEKM